MTGEEVTTAPANEAQVIETIAAEANETQSPVLENSASVEVGSEETEAVDTLDPDERVALLEALLFANGDPLPLESLAAISKLADLEVREALAGLKTRYEQTNSGVELVEVAGRYQIRTKVFLAPFVRELKAGKPRRLSAAALETLAVIAYRQPVVRSDVEKIRGVDVTPTLKTLLERKLVRIVGHQESVGQPALYGTTDDFLKVFGLSSLSQLPTLRDLKELERDPGETVDEGVEENQPSEPESIETQVAQSA